MNTALEAINKLVEGVNLAQARGAYDLREASSFWAAIEFLASLQNQAPAPEQPQAPVEREEDRPGYMPPEEPNAQYTPEQPGSSNNY